MSDELAAAEEKVRAIVESTPVPGGFLDVYVEEYDRRGRELARTDKGWARALDEVDKMDACVARLKADLARALPVVEAAEALVEEARRLSPVERDAVDDVSPALLVAVIALAVEIRAAREPRTGEG